MTVLDQSPCLPDPNLKLVRKRRRFETIGDIKANLSQTLKDVSNEPIQDCFAKWKHCCEKQTGVL